MIGIVFLILTTAILKRAKNTHKASRRLIDEEIPFSILARGEGTNIDAGYNRRVEIILHSPNTVETQPVVIEEPDPKCFFTAFGALQYCNVRDIKKRKKDYVYIEAVDLPEIKDGVYYYMQTNSEGEKQAKRVRWKPKTTGKLWWKKTRLVTTIPKKSFEEFQIFTMSKGPCDGCEYEVVTEDTAYRYVTHFFPDAFVMRNVQTRKKMFKRKIHKVRVPREYINLEEQYYSNNSPYTSSGSQSIVWETKSGKKNLNYYFTKLESENGNLPYIQRFRSTLDCANSWKKDGIGDHCWITCGGVRRDGKSIGVGGSSLRLAPGVFYQNDSVTGYLALDQSLGRRSTITSLKIGINTRLGLYSSLSFDYHFLSKSFSPKFSEKTLWKALKNEPPTYRGLGTMFGGVEVKTSMSKDYLSFVETNVHLGLMYLNWKRSILDRVYLKGGVGKDLTNRVSTKFYPTVELGAIIKFRR